MDDKLKYNLKKYTLKTLTYILLIVIAIILMMPFLWTFFTSVKTEAQIISETFSFLPQGDWAWENYAIAVDSMDYWQALKNTLIITIPKLFGDILVSAMVAYGFARFDFPAKKVIFLILLATLMVPFEVTMIPLYIVYSEIGWINTFLPLVVPAMFGAAQFIFFLTMYYMTMPKDLISAARVDGFTNFEIFRKIYLPIGVPALVVVGIWSFQGSWNDLLGPLIWLQDASKFTLQLTLASLSTSTTFHVSQGVIMAGTILVMLPILIVFIALQRYILDSSKSSGIKG